MPPREDYETERYADPLDAASGQALMENQHKVAAARLGSRPQQVQNADGTWPHTECVEEDCGEPLPALRLQMGRIRCVDCQAKAERFRR